MLNKIRKALHRVLRDKDCGLLADVVFTNLPKDTNGFTEIQTGGGCVALHWSFSVNDTEYCVVLTDSGGCALPEDNDWIACTYRGEWMSEEDVLAEAICTKDD